MRTIRTSEQISINYFFINFIKNIEYFFKNLLITMKNFYFFISVLFCNLIASNDIAIGHAPIGVMADHFHSSGEKMVSARFSNMQMKGNVLHGISINDQSLISTQNNPYAAMSGAPSMLSIIPQKMNMKMLMLGGMYAPSNDITLMGMLMFMKNEMDLKAYRGMMGRDFLGGFQTSAEDISNISFSVLYRLNQSDKSRMHLEIGVDKSIGDNNRKHKILTPMNTFMNVVMPYAMQNDNSTRLIFGLTNSLSFKNLIFGSQLRIKTVIDDKVWAFGDKYEISTWVQKSLNDNVALSTRLHFINQRKISGRNIEISGPVQSANPMNYGGRTMNLGFGFNTLFNLLGGEHRDRFGLEILFPIYENKNGLQMKSDYKIQFGYQKSF